MRSLLRMILLVLVAAGFAAPALASMAAPLVVSQAEPPCPSKRVVLEQCPVDSAAQAAMPRAGVSADAPCSMKAIEARAADPAPSHASRALAFEVRSARWTGWTPPGIDPPPRS
ncbi:hypothetical protein [Antarcticirhabdus aurantiaca]|uniref:Uncharacterized protein n=1 Tax=Antarcticirhabdus aurantiaca TaxID=2606717 RepID=A0ACD4NP10_9HYPH|nr:hypothetical protein [Antarcticirhabdus aurantiaca]WAJ28629.1 hypothetical protein OXU80_28175 [Jeongeuplla avenae]